MERDNQPHPPSDRCPECGAVDSPRGPNHTVGCTTAVSERPTTSTTQEPPR